MGRLTVFLEKCKSLQDKDMIGKSDPYVTFTIHKKGFLGSTDAGQQKSSVKQDELDPVYNETFKFNVESLEGHSLYMSVKDEDTGKDDLLGKCEIDLEQVEGLADGKECSIEEIIDSTTFTTGNGRIFLKLSWEP